MIVDRFEGEYAVLEDNQNIIKVATIFLPNNTKEGDVVVKTSNGYKIDVAQTNLRRKRITEKENCIFKTE